MAESLFEIFGDHHNRQVVKNVTRQPLSNIGKYSCSRFLSFFVKKNLSHFFSFAENMGKMVSAGPIKPNEPMKKAGKPKKSFLSNTGKALQGTPARKVFTPRAVNVASLIYSDDNDQGSRMEQIEFTKPTYRFGE